MTYAKNRGGFTEDRTPPAGCTRVAFYETGQLSDPIMVMEDDPALVHFYQKIYYSVEGSVGGIGGGPGARSRTGAPGGRGNPFLDEASSVIEPVVLFDYDVTPRSKAHGEFSCDHVSSASMKRLSRYPQQSGASGDDYFGARGGLDYQWNERTTVGGFLSAASNTTIGL